MAQTTSLIKAIAKLKEGAALSGKELLELQAYYEGVIVALSACRPIPAEYRLVFDDANRQLITVQDFINARLN